MFPLSVTAPQTRLDSMITDQAFGAMFCNFRFNQCFLRMAHAPQIISCLHLAWRHVFCRMCQVILRMSTLTWQHVILIVTSRRKSHPPPRRRVLHPVMTSRPNSSITTITRSLGKASCLFVSEWVRQWAPVTRLLQLEWRLFRFLFLLSLSFCWHYFFI